MTAAHLEKGTSQARNLYVHNIPINPNESSDVAVTNLHASKKRDIASAKVVYVQCGSSGRRTSSKRNIASTRPVCAQYPYQEELMALGFAHAEDAEPRAIGVSQMRA